MYLVLPTPKNGKIERLTDGETDLYVTRFVTASRSRGAVFLALILAAIGAMQ